jgi:hypothetical protein
VTGEFIFRVHETVVVAPNRVWSLPAREMPANLSFVSWRHGRCVHRNRPVGLFRPFPDRQLAPAEQLHRGRGSIVPLAATMSGADDAGRDPTS